MSSPTELLIAAIDAIVSAARALPADGDVMAVLEEAELLEVQHKLGDAQRAIDACASVTAGKLGTGRDENLATGGWPSGKASARPTHSCNMRPIRPRAQHQSWCRWGR